MDAESILTIMKMTQPLATIEHAQAMAEYGRARGLTPFAEFYPIFAEKKEKRGDQWTVVGLKGLTFKEHYSVQGRWSQKSGGYSTPMHTSEAAAEISYGKSIPGIRVTVGIITNRDYAALAQMAMAQIPGWDYKEEREAFVHYGEAFVPNSHRPPSGWTVEGVARKRATEQALKLAFGKEPTQAANIYAVSMDDQRPRLETEEARSLLYPERKSRPALTVVDADPITPPDEEPPAVEGEWSDEADAENVGALQAEADAGLPGTPATRSVMTEAPAGLSAKWPLFCTEVKEMLAYDSLPHIKATLYKLRGEDYEIFHTSGPDSGKLADDPTVVWGWLAEYKAQA